MKFRYYTKSQDLILSFSDFKSLLSITKFKMLSCISKGQRRHHL